MELKFFIVIVTRKAKSLLIVPYGIEIRLLYYENGHQKLLLIVPYGIEILFRNQTIYKGVHTFNCTLWN